MELIEKLDDLQLTEGRIVTLATGSDGVRRFKMLAYTGARVSGGFNDIIIDLAGVTLGAQRKPILLSHDPAKIVGFSESATIDGDGIRLEGVLSSATEAGREVAATADEGFPWEASVGIAVDKAVRLDDGEEREVNGKMHKGPLTIIQKSRLREVSFVPNGADAKTRVAVFSGHTVQLSAACGATSRVARFAALGDELRRAEARLAAARAELAG